MIKAFRRLSLREFLFFSFLFLFPAVAFGQNASVVDSIGGLTGNVTIGGLTAASPIITSGQGSAVVPVTTNNVVIPNYQTFTAINPAGTLAALTVTLPSLAGQGQCTKFSIQQIITSLTNAAPTGFTIVGTAVSGATTGAFVTYEYCLMGTVWYRTL